MVDAIPNIRGSFCAGAQDSGTQGLAAQKSEAIINTNTLAAGMCCIHVGMYLAKTQKAVAGKTNALTQSSYTTGIFINTILVNASCISASRGLSSVLLLRGHEEKSGS